MIKYMDKILMACMALSAIAAIYLSLTKEHLLYVG